MISLRVLLISALSILSASAWHTCQDENFCTTLRNRQVGKFSVKSESIHVTESTVQAVLVKHSNSEEYDFLLKVFASGAFQVKIKHVDAPTKPIPSAILENLPLGKINTEITRDKIIIQGESTKIIIEIPIFSLVCISELTKTPIILHDLFVDEAIALKIQFNNTQHAYGLPEHGERLELKDTKGAEPYRLFNLDYGYYKVESPESLYGSVPVLYAHGEDELNTPAHVSGVFWHNPAQTFVDIDHSNNAITADFISEAGTLDLFILPGGSSFKHAVSGYVQLTGTAPLPPLFALGYHQSRYSYLSQDKVEEVVSKLRENDFPADVIWLDIDYTDGKRYFTWNYNAFPDPTAMQEKLKNLGMRLVTIIDPHIKAEPGYFVYDQMKQGNYYVKNTDGSPYEGSCWPGMSSYVDFFNPEALKWWGGLYNYSNFPNTGERVSIWNDMNEPSVFDVDEKTMARNLLHYGNIEHKEVHNMYGYMQTKGTYQGLLARDDEKQRPFLLTRSHFAGSQRFAAIWTGDNIATWEHLRVSISICLTEALAGISFCGADVGGFIERPTEELFQRWYQLGAWYPFFRAHSNNEQDYRDPYLYPKDVQQRFRNAIKQRYAHLPYWYTLWYEHERYGEPVLRPLIYEYTNDVQVTSIDTEFLIGENILVAPVLHEGAEEVEVYLPGDVWFYHETPTQVTTFQGGAKHNIKVNMDTVPVFYKAGSMIPRKDRAVNSTEDLRKTPLNLYFYLKNNKAEGRFYADDTLSFEYRNKQYCYLTINFVNDRFSSQYHDDSNCVEPLKLGSTLVFYDTEHRPQFTKAILNNGVLRREFPVQKVNNSIRIDFNVEINHINDFNVIFA